MVKIVYNIICASWKHDVFFQSLQLPRASDSSCETLYVNHPRISLSFPGSAGNRGLWRPDRNLILTSKREFCRTWRTLERKPQSTLRLAMEARHSHLWLQRFLEHGGLSLGHNNTEAQRNPNILTQKLVSFVDCVGQVVDSRKILDKDIIAVDESVIWFDVV